MLQGITKCGMGNWIDISEQYVKSKSPEEVEEHYFAFYYKTKETPYPSTDDIIFKSNRQIRQDRNETIIEIPYDNRKITEAQHKKQTYHQLRQQEVKEEE